MNARAQNMFSRDVKLLSFRCQTLKFSLPNVKFYFSTLLKENRGRNHQKGIPLSSDFAESSERTCTGLFFFRRAEKWAVITQNLYFKQCGGFLPNTFVSVEGKNTLPSCLPQRRMCWVSSHHIGRRLRISKSAVSKIIKQYNLTGSTAPKTLTVPKCTFQDSVLLETMVQASGSSSFKELRDDFAIHGDCGELSTSTISRNIRNKLPSGRNYSRKRLGKSRSERFTPGNIVYTQLYIDCLKDKDPSCVKFFDEVGFQLTAAGHRNFGFSSVVEDCVVVRRYLCTANLTLNFLVGYDGVKCGNIIEGTSNSVQFLRFFDEASQQLIQ